MSAGDRTIRGTVKPFWRDKQGLWFARGWVPERQADGRIARRRIERGPGVSAKAQCQKLCDDLNRLYEGRALAVKKPLTFARAVENYLTAGHESRFLTERLLVAIGLRQCADIDDTVMTDLSRQLYPNATPATINRQLYTPVIAVLRMAAKGGHCPRPDFTRPKGHDHKPAIDVPTDAWFAKVLPECAPNLRAMILFLSVHGRRLGDALQIPAGGYDPAARSVLIGKTKTGAPLVVRLADPVADAIEATLPHKHAQLFQYAPKSRRSVLRAIERAAERAGVAYHATHELGRHAFATRLFAQGYSSKHVATSGGWSSTKMVHERYGHLEKSSLDDSVRELGIKWVEGLQAERGADVIPVDFAQKKQQIGKG